MTRVRSASACAAQRSDIVGVPGGTARSARYRVPRRYTVLSGIALAVSSGCSRQAANAAQTGETLTEPTVVAQVSGQPAVDIGLVEGAPAYLLHQALSSVRLRDGRIVVLNAGSHELRFYDAQGKHLGSAGGKGDGPGEFRRPARITLTDPDTLVVFDPGADRESVFDTRGKFLRATPVTEQEGEPFPRDAWLYGGAFIDGPARIADRAPVRALLDALPPAVTGSPFRFVLVDGQQRVWVRRTAGDAAPAEWDVYGIDGAPLARVTTPPSFELQHIGHDFLLGRTHDAMNVEHILLYPVSGLPAATRSGPPALATHPENTSTQHPSDAALRQMRSVLRNMMTQQEVFYSKPANGYRYASRVDQLEWPEDTTGLVIQILSAGPAGWSAIMLHEGEGFSCGVSTGTEGPVGWRSGIVLCP